MVVWVSFIINPIPEFQDKAIFFFFIITWKGLHRLVGQGQTGINVIISNTRPPIDLMHDYARVMRLGGGGVRR